MIKKLLSGIGSDKVAIRRAQSNRDRIRKEAAIGGDLFGPIPEGRRREFFCLDEHTWVWHEEWTDQNGVRQIQMTRYDVRPSGIVKSLNGGGYMSVGRDELANFLRAVKSYRNRVRADIYHLPA